MKRIAFLAVLCVTHHLANAQKITVQEVPSLIMEQFTIGFPYVKNIRWSKKNENEYKATYRLNRRQTSSNFNLQGEFLLPETSLDITQLPIPIQAVIHKDFILYDVKNVVKVTTANQEVFYEVVIRKRPSQFEIKFSEVGKILSKQEMNKKGS